MGFERMKRTDSRANLTVVSVLNLTPVIVVCDYAILNGVEKSVGASEQIDIMALLVLDNDGIRLVN